MALEIFRLVGSIFVDNEKANESIGKTDKKAEGMGKTLLGGVKTAAKWGAAIVGAAATVTTALVGVASNTATTCDTIDKASQRVGISAESYQKLAYAADLSGVSTANLETAAKKLAKNQPGAALDETLIRLAGITDESKRAEEAQKLFGTSAYNLTPLLNAGADGIKGMMTECENLGLVISNDGVAAGAQFNDTMTKLKDTAASLGNIIGVKLFPIVNNIGNLILEHMPQIQAVVGDLANVLVDMLSALLPPLIQIASAILPPLMDILQTLIPVVSQIIQAILPVIVDLLNMLLPPIVQIVQMILPLLVSLIQPLLPLLQPIIQLLQPLIDLLMAVLAPCIELINMILPPLVTLLTNIIQFIMPALQGTLEVVAGVISNLIGGLLKVIINVIKAIIDTFSNLIDYIRNIFAVAWESGLQTMISIFSTIWDTFKTIFSSVKNIFMGIIDFIRNVFTGNWQGAWQSIISIFSNIWALIKAPINAAKNILSSMLNFVRNVFVAAWQPIWQGVIKVFTSIWNRISEPVNKVKSIFKELINFVKNVFTGNWKGAWQSIIKIFSSIWSGLKGAVKAPINAVIKIINGFIKGINKLKIPDWVPVVGGKGINIPTIPLLAKGGEIAKAGRVIVGDAGPEMLDLPVGAKVTPLRNGSGLASDDEVIRILRLVLAELKELGSSLYDVILDALVNGTKIDWDNRELARLVKKFA